MARSIPVSHSAPYKMSAMRKAFGVCTVDREDAQPHNFTQFFLE